MKNKPLAVICAVFAALSLCGCGEDTSDGFSGSSSKENNVSDNSASDYSSLLSEDSISSIYSSVESSLSDVSASTEQSTESSAGKPTVSDSGYKIGHTNDGVLIEKYLGVGGEVVVPSKLEGRPVAEIGGSAFYKRADITTLTIPDSVTEIAEDAFCGCIALKTADLGDGITEIHDGVFYGCAGLASVNIGRNTAEIGASAFCDCKSLERITLPAVAKIGDNAFRGCSALRSVTFANGLRKIGGEAFRGCTSLSAISIPDSVTEIGNEAFDGCRSIQVTYKGDKYDYEHIYELYAEINNNRH